MLNHKKIIMFLLCSSSMATLGMWTHEIINRYLNSKATALKDSNITAETLSLLMISCPVLSTFGDMLALSQRAPIFLALPLHHVFFMSVGAAVSTYLLYKIQSKNLHLAYINIGILLTLIISITTGFMYW
jgi:hypothetical protein